MKHLSLLAGSIVLLALCLTNVMPPKALALTQTATPTPAAQSPSVSRNVRNARYCEVLTVALKRGKLVASVYNTLGLNECPEDIWKAMDVNAIRKQFGTAQVLMNGPRYFIMDQIVAKGATQSGETVTIGGLGFTKRAEVELTLNMMKSVPYQVRDIQRDTQYVFKKGELVYQLVAADGQVYVMQSYSLQVDSTLTIDALTTLGDRLQLPEGWKYQVVTLDKDLILSAHGVAHLIQDEFVNSYQRIESTDLATLSRN